MVLFFIFRFFFEVKKKVQSCGAIGIKGEQRDDNVGNHMGVRVFVNLRFCCFNSNGVRERKTGIGTLRWVIDIPPATLGCSLVVF